MPDGRIIAIYTPFQLRPPRFVVQRRQSVGPEVFELHRCLSLKQLIVEILNILNSAHPEFLSRLQEYDDRAFQGSPHKTRRYIADRRDLLYINSPHLTEPHSVKVWAAAGSVDTDLS